MLQGIICSAMILFPIFMLNFSAAPSPSSATSPKNSCPGVTGAIIQGAMVSLPQYDGAPWYA